MWIAVWLGFPAGSTIMSPSVNTGRFVPWVGKILGRSKWQPTPVFLPGKSHGKRNLAGYSPWGCKRVGCNLETKQKQANCSSLWRGRGWVSFAPIFVMSFLKISFNGIWSFMKLWACECWRKQKYEMEVQGSERLEVVANYMVFKWSFEGKTSENFKIFLTIANYMYKTIQGCVFVCV